MSKFDSDDVRRQQLFKQLSYRNFLFGIQGTPGRPAGSPKAIFHDLCVFLYILAGFPCFPMVRWCGICVIEPNGKYYMAVSLLLSYEDGSKG